ncbi:hypothetical protein QBC40DRAFT_216863 [Triangularia verruculosa]|uniref:Rhodopsin domain-containing protein n=1 Tax=Triangularia verruculosa TaxID=2587418 RepID=A0AAN6XPT4_9PEZI|nr:hypothetical protein QBC40DRAFT_216863 [Triangularia verruculosa]
MTLYSSPPAARPFGDDKPTLLTSWWITLLCAFLILLRLVGRFVRVEKLFGEDKVAALVLIPLFLRMAFVHPILVFGTNNVELNDELDVSDEGLRRRAIGSGLVLISRIIYAVVLWLLKLVTLEFFDRLVGQSGRNRYTMLLRSMRIALVVTFVAVVVSDLAECQPFPKYWQVTPDPGPQCRQGYANLLTVSVCNALTDLLLVVFPVPIVIQSRLPVGHKSLLVALFCLHIFTVVVAVYRVPQIINEQGYQATRTTWASAEILMATFAANALTIGTFMRDKGAKKRKFKYEATASSANRRNSRMDSTTVSKKPSWDEDDDLEADYSKGQGGVMARTRTPDISPSTSKQTEDGQREIKSPRLHHGSRSASMDSLIPRGRHTPGSQVMKTTTFEVTVSSSDGQEHDQCQKQAQIGLRLAPVHGAVTATAKGRARGSSILLREMNPLPDNQAEAGQQQRR